MAVHLIHVSKAGGTALRFAIRASRVSSGGRLKTPWGEVWGHDHRFTLSDVPREDVAFFALRDPISRFLSGYYSRLRKGAPRYFVEWTDAEARAFKWFPTPQELADALAEPSGKPRRRAEFAMKSIRHVKRPLTFWTGKPSYLRKHIDKVIYIARQETLDEDWEKLKELLGLPSDQMLPKDDTYAHRTVYAADDDRTLSGKGEDALRAWYADDYKLIEIAEELRSGELQRSGSLLDRLVPLERIPGVSALRRAAR
jgi:hypothetical protein